jgi:broad specificity phosphatase PhoE
MRITASFPPGVKHKALRLGQYWVRQKIVLDRVCSGPRVRQRDTARIVAKVYSDAGLSFPEPVVMQEFDEYQGDAVLEKGLPLLLESNNEIRGLHRAFQESINPGQRLANFEKFPMLITKWVECEVVLPTVESWTEFCTRVGPRSNPKHVHEISLLTYR